MSRYGAGIKFDYSFKPDSRVKLNFFLSNALEINTQRRGGKVKAYDDTQRYEENTYDYGSKVMYPVWANSIGMAITILNAHRIVFTLKQTQLSTNDMLLAMNPQGIGIPIMSNVSQVVPNNYNLYALNENIIANNHTPIQQVAHHQALNSQYFVMAIATSALREWLKTAHLPQKIKILCASKGIESGSGAFVSDIMEEYIPHKSIAYLCGPSFASEVVCSLPCALVIHSRNLNLSREFGALMPHFIKTYASPDVVGGEVAGAYKNVIAIAGGICDGLAFGMNAKASLLARGLVEMSRFGEHFGAKMETFLGLSGAGDLFLTSNSTMSRNYRVGLGLAGGKKIDEILKELGEVAEGVITAKAITEIGQREHIYTPIAKEISLILEGKSVKESLKSLMA